MPEQVKQALSLFTKKVVYLTVGILGLLALAHAKAGNEYVVGLVTLVATAMGGHVATNIAAIKAGLEQKK
jgi:hypothetical protein